MLIEVRLATDPELAALVVTQQHELNEPGPPDDQVDVAGDVRYLVGVVAGRVVACGALRALDRDSAEISGMYVRPAHRGKGLARQLLAALEGYALAAGHTELRLRPGTYPPAAIALFTSAGYARVSGHGEHLERPHTAYFTRRLPVLA